MEEPIKIVANDICIDIEELNKNIMKGTRNLKMLLGGFSKILLMLCITASIFAGDLSDGSSAVKPEFVFSPSTEFYDDFDPLGLRAQAA